MKTSKHLALSAASLIFLCLTYFPLKGQSTPGAGSAGTTNSGPTGTYPGSGSSITNVPTVPPGTTPGQGSAGTNATPPNGTYPGSGSSPNPVH